MKTIYGNLTRDEFTPADVWSALSQNPDLVPELAYAMSGDGDIKADALELARLGNAIVSYLEGLPTGARPDELNEFSEMVEQFKLDHIDDAWLAMSEDAAIREAA